MKPTKHLDRFVAETILETDMDSLAGFAPRYSADMRASIDIVKKLKKHNFELHYSPGKGWTAYFFPVGKEVNMLIESSVTPELAICKAALRLKGFDFEE